METGLIMLGGGVVVGVFGSLLGLGGGILIVPLLTIGFGLPVRDAVGVSLVCVIMTSGASASVYLERKVANLRLGMLLELFTASGAVIGGAIAFLIAPQVLEGLFAILLVYTALTMLRAAQATPAAASPPAPASGSPEATAAAAPVAADVPRAGGRTASFLARLSPAAYRIRHLRLAAGLSVFAGVASALLGIGGGLIKVPVMHLVMGVPLRVATATSNLMIGITGSTSAIVYLLRGGINPIATAPTAVGVFIGASIGSRVAHRVDIRVLRLLFVAVLLYTAFEMAQKAMGPAWNPADDGRLEHRIARILTVGTLVSVALLAIGAVLAVAAGVSPFTPPPAFDPARIVDDVVALRPTGFIWLGLLGTLVTPGSRVVAALVGYARQGEHGMAVISALILVVIAIGVVAGIAGG